MRRLNAAVTCDTRLDKQLRNYLILITISLNALNAFCPTRTSGFGFSFIVSLIRAYLYKTAKYFRGVAAQKSLSLHPQKHNAVVYAPSQSKFSAAELSSISSFFLKSAFFRHLFLFEEFQVESAVPQKPVLSH